MLLRKMGEDVVTPVVELEEVEVVDVVCPETRVTEDVDEVEELVVEDGVDDVDAELVVVELLEVVDSLGALDEPDEVEEEDVLVEVADVLVELVVVRRPTTPTTTAAKMIIMAMTAARNALTTAGLSPALEPPRAIERRSSFMALLPEMGGRQPDPR